VPRSPSPRRVGAALLVAALGAVQSPGFRLSYDVRVVERRAGETRVIATGQVRGPEDTDLRLSIRTDTAELDALLDVFPEPDTATLSGAFFSERRVGRSRRGLPLWETDGYRRTTRLPWGGLARLYPFGPPRPGQRRALWLEIGVRREFVGGETRPEEEFVSADSSLAIALHAVVRPRRAVVRVTLVRGDAVSAPKLLDMTPDAAPRSVTFVLGRRESRTLDLALTRADPPQDARDSALATDADVVCLRVLEPGATEPAQIRCGRLDNVARRLPLASPDTLLSADTLVATFTWPPGR
jgi:hypothetical protein